MGDRVSLANSKVDNFSQRSLVNLTITHLRFPGLIKNSRDTERGGRTDGRLEYFEASELTRFLRVRKGKFATTKKSAS